uniref:chitin synthase chs-2-like n=1 Tax=Styela clava TaxID=7725 RepID=UPI00193A306D|nr:chitin synthase chs-2-like [Styela clava]
MELDGSIEMPEQSQTTLTSSTTNDEETNEQQNSFESVDNVREVAQEPAGESELTFPTHMDEDLPRTESCLLRKSKKVAKYISALIIFGIMLLGPVVSEFTLLVLGNAYTQDYSDSRCPYVKEGRDQQYNYPRYMVMLILMSCLCFADVLSLLYSLWNVIKTRKTRKCIKWKICFLGLLPEILNAVGLTFFVLEIIPNVDATLVSLMFPIVSLVPAFIQVITENWEEPDIIQGNDEGAGRRNRRNFIIGIVAVILLLIGYVVICYLVYQQQKLNGDVHNTLAYTALSAKYPEIKAFINWKTTYQSVYWYQMLGIVVIGFLPGFFGFIFVTRHLRKANDIKLKILHEYHKKLGEQDNESRNKRDIFEYEVHIFFDDALDQSGEINSYVKCLLESISKAASKIRRLENNLRSKILDTPYGGRIKVFNNSTNTELITIHLKDKSRIRNGKRWSQCMYMSYLLKYLPITTPSAHPKEDTFILALDGDVDFQPDSLTYLLDQMKIGGNVGAACGRIHPIGSGPVVWFQKFEYAVGHWLQKTTEDVLGCVLCSPGCFSLIRSSALLTSNVAGSYTEISKNAKQKLQRDQGEDRWLCTLLLKAGYKIVYCAASDSFTYAPTTLKELFRQRRRWGPSTMANVLDVLLCAKLVIRKNNSITMVYIIYQLLLMAATLLGPATVILVIQGAFQFVFGMSEVGGLLLALIPVIIYVIICYTTSCDFQIIVAQILTVLYAFVMMSVLVGVVAQMVDNKNYSQDLHFSI